MNVNDIWNSFLEKMRKVFNPVSFSTWFDNTKLHEISDKKITLIVPMAVHKRMFLSNYYELINDTFAEITGIQRELDCILEDEIVTESEELVSIIYDNEEVVNKKVEHFDSNLNKNLLFDNFVVGDTNKFAKTAALAVAQSPGNQYNPLFIYGKSGLGKTHLMHAIGNYIEENNKDLKVLYTTSDEFRKDYTGISNTDNSIDYAKEFKNKYRNIDVLIIDDIQYLVGAEKTQEEFFHTFNDLHSRNKQIIISSDRSPDDLKLLEDRLRTRFCWGLTVNIFPPDFALRTEIIKKKIIAGNFEQEIPEDVIEYIASNINTDVRNLEGSITRVIAYSAIMGGSEITLDLAIEALKDYISKGMGEKDDVSRIQKIVSEYFQISVEDIRSKKRSSNISFPRQIAMYLCREMTSESFPKIGLEFGGKDHSTVMHSVEKIEKEILVNQELANIIEKLKKEIV